MVKERLFTTARIEAVSRPYPASSSSLAGHRPYKLRAGPAQQLGRPGKDAMHFHLSTDQVLWTLTFAALLVLLVVLLGRDRARRFPLFMASIAVVTLRLLVTRLLFNRIKPLVLSEILLTLADLGVLAALLVIVEMARTAFAQASRWAAIGVTLAALAVSGTALAVWGPWPSWATLRASSTLATLRRMQMAAEKGDLLAGMLAIELAFLVVFFGRRFHAGWRSHVHRIVLGLAAVAAAQLAVRGAWQAITLKAVVHSRAQYDSLMTVRDRMYSANDIVYLCVLIWWIVCLWCDEPGARADGAESSAPRIAKPAARAAT